MSINIYGMSAYATSFFLPLVPSSAARGNNIGTSCAEKSHLSDDHDEKPSTHTCAEGASTKRSSTSRVPDILISVQSASVDPVGFVRALTGTSRKRPLPPPRPHASSNNNNAGPAKLNIEPRTGSDIGSSASDSIQFELSISHGGRKYSATRTLHRLVRLRQDLMREIAERRPGIVVPKRPPHHDNYGDDDDTALTSAVSGHSFDSDHQSRQNGNQRSQISSDACTNPPPPVVMIPELPVAGSSDASDDRPSATAPRRDHRGLPVPPTSTATNTSGLVSGSFTALHLALMRYGPAVEEWFRHILTDILPDPGSSPSLLAFLWEPAAGPTTATGKPGIAGGKRHGSTRSIGTLGSIDEKDDGGDGDEEEDEEVTGGGYY